MKDADPREHAGVRRFFYRQALLTFVIDVRLKEWAMYFENKIPTKPNFKHERPKYVEGKGPIIWDILQKAHLWSQEVEWKPGISDM